MADHAFAQQLPLRPLTTGELLDAAVILLRTRPRPLLAIGAALVIGEQILLGWLRVRAGVDGSFLPDDGLLGPFGVLIAVGFATEAVIIAVLGASAARGAPAALVGPAAPPTRRANPASVGVIALVAAVGVTGSAVSFLLPMDSLQLAGLVVAAFVTAALFPFGYGLLGLATPALVIEGLSPLRAIGRSVRLSVRLTLRGAMIRSFGYLVWGLVRVAIVTVLVGVTDLVFTSPSATVDVVIISVAGAMINLLTYPMLACLDVAVHLDTRMRTEGLDIAVRRALRRGVSAATALAVPA